MGIWINGEDEASAKGLNIKPELYRFDAHVRSCNNHRVKDMGVNNVDCCSI